MKELPVKRFEDLFIWKEARSWVSDIYSRLKGNSDFGFCNQIERASVSIMSNIAEGYERSSMKEFCHFLYIARGSAGEVRSLLYVAEDLEYMDREIINDLQKRTIRISVGIWRLIQKVS